MGEVIVVIDPGHGGENEGALWQDYIEKEINLRVAKSMKTELEKYENVKVYMTRTDDIDMTLEERAQFAQDKNADLLACLHFNMSEYHTLYGTECWVSAYGDCYAKGFDFAKITNELLSAEGLHSRGVKTRLGKKDQDYYGLIRHSTSRGIPSCIIEHCHLDRVEDEPFVNHDTWLDRYGVIDATAVAKYFGLKSEILNVDFSNYIYEKTAIPNAVMGPDKTEPEECVIKRVNYNSEKDVIQVEVSAKESDSFLCYYTYSLDGGETFCELQSWEYGKNDIVIEIPMPSRNLGDLIVCAHNNHDLIKSSEPVNIASVFIQRQQYQKDLLEAVEQERLEQLKNEQSIDGVFNFTEEPVPKGTLFDTNITTSGMTLLSTLVVILILLLCLRHKLRRK